MDGLINQLTHLRPTDMSIVMLVVALVDLWAAVSLSVKAKSTLSKSLIYGLINNLLIISIPFGLQSLVSLIPADHADTTYVNTVSMLVTVCMWFQRSHQLWPIIPRHIRKVRTGSRKSLTSTYRKRWPTNRTSTESPFRVSKDQPTTKTTCAGSRHG